MKDGEEGVIPSIYTKLPLLNQKILIRTGKLDSAFNITCYSL